MFAPNPVAVNIAKTKKYLIMGKVYSNYDQ